MIERARAALELLEHAPAAASQKRIDAKSALAYGLYLAHRQREADAAYAEIVALLEASGRDRTLAAADAWNNWGMVHFDGDIRRAEPLFRRTVELRRAIEGESSVAPTFTFNLAGALHQLGRRDEAVPWFEETIRTAAARGEKRVEFDAMMELSEVYLEQRELDRAVAQLARLEPFLADKRFNRFRRAQYAYYQGRLALARGEVADAQSRFATSVGLFDQEPQKIAMNVHALIGLARAEQASGDPAGARAAADRALTLAESFVERGTPSYLIGHALAVRGELEAARGDAEAARSTYKAAWEHLDRTLGADHPATRDARARSTS